MNRYSILVVASLGALLLTACAGNNYVPTANPLTQGAASLGKLCSKGCQPPIGIGVTRDGKLCSKGCQPPIGVGVTRDGKLCSKGCQPPIFVKSATP